MTLLEIGLLYQIAVGGKKALLKKIGQGPKNRSSPTFFSSYGLGFFQQKLAEPWE